jgi:hypothetical protein
LDIIPIPIFVSAIGTLTAIVIVLWKFRHDNIKTRNKACADLLTEIDAVIEDSRRMVSDPRNFIKHPPKKLGSASYFAFKITLGKTDTKEIEKAYYNYKNENFNMANVKALRDAVIKINSR